MAAQDDLVGNAVRGVAQNVRDTFSYDNLKNKAKTLLNIKNSDKPDSSGVPYPGLMTTNATSSKPVTAPKPAPKKAPGKTY